MVSIRTFNLKHQTELSILLPLYGLIFIPRKEYIRKGAWQVVGEEELKGVIVGA